MTESDCNEQQQHLISLVKIDMTSKLKRERERDEIEDSPDELDESRPERIGSGARGRAGGGRSGLKP